MCHGRWASACVLLAAALAVGAAPPARGGEAADAPPAKPADTGDAPAGAAKKDAPALRLAGGGALPVKAEPADPPPLPPVPNLPPASSMGGFPKAPDRPNIDDPASLQGYIQDNLSVTLRGGGLLRLYGFLRGDYDTATHRFNDLQNPFFVLPQDSRFRVGPAAVPLDSYEPNYSLYPRLSRFGLEYYGTPIDRLGGAVPAARAEVDFLTVNSPGTAQNPESRPLIRLRLAYGTVTCDEFTLLVGQDWDIIAPLIPSINDNTNMWNAGNLGDRRAQIKFLWDHDLGGDRVFQLQNGLFLANAVNNADVDGNGERDHEQTGLPGYQGRLGLVLPTAEANEKVVAGVWCAFALYQTQGVLPPVQTPVPGFANAPFSPLVTRRFVSNAVGADLRLPIVPGFLTFQGEVFHGKNIDDLRGGIAQGLVLPTANTVETSGGWAELVCRPVPWYQVAVGGTIDKPVRSDVTGVQQLLFPGFPTLGVNDEAGRTLNWTWYVSNRFPVGGGLTLGLDYTFWTTEYVGFKQGQASLVKFFLQQSF